MYFIPTVLLENIVNANPYVFSVLGLLGIALQIVINMSIARNLLPAVRKAHELPLEKRIKLIAAAALKTQRIKYERIITLIVIYLPVMCWLAWKEESIWPGFAFMLVTCAQVFIIWVARNHAQIVSMQVDKFNLHEAETYLAYIEKDNPR